LTKLSEGEPRVGRIFSPARWTFASVYPAIERQSGELRDRIKEFVKNRAKASVRVVAIAKGATALEAQNSKSAAKFIGDTSKSFNIDLRAVAQNESSPEITPATANRITRAAPKVVIASANRRVTVAIRNAYESRVQDAENSAMADFQAAEAIGIPNPRLNSHTE
jgi:hypothetical protein